MLEVRGIIVWDLVHVVVLYPSEDLQHELDPAVLSLLLVRHGLDVEDEALEGHWVILPQTHTAICETQNDKLDVFRLESLRKVI